MSGERRAAAERRIPLVGGSFEAYYDHAVSEFPWTSRALITVIIVLVWAFTKLVWPWRVERDDVLRRVAPGSVIVMNHQSMLDPVAVITHFWLHKIPVRTIYKSEFDRHGIVSWLFSRAGAFPVERASADMRAVRRAKAALGRGECVLIFAEGTRVRSDEQAVEVHGGYALMAQLAKAPVVPLAIVGARELRLRSHVYLRCGDPVRWEDLAATTRKAQLAEMEQTGMARVYDLVRELREEHPDLAGED